MLAKKIMEQKFECKFCKKKFHKEITLTTHMCVKKQRYMDADAAGPRFGLRVFQRFYTLTIRGTKTAKSLDEFINSPYYIDFVKFGNHLATLRPLHPEQYIDYVLLNGVKLKDWSKDFVYDVYIEDLVRKEPADAGCERTISEIMKWSEENNTAFTDFFTAISANEAAYLVHMGLISPWVLYLSESGGNLIGRFNEDHAKMVSGIIDASFWMKRFKKSPDDVEFIRSLLEQVGL